MSACCSQFPACAHEAERHAREAPQQLASADPHANCKACARCGGCVTCGYCKCLPPRFIGLGHRIPVEAGLLAFWRTRNQRAVIVASLARRLGLLTDEGLLVRVFGICVYGQAQQVLTEGVEIATAAEQREQLQLRRSAA